MKPEPSNLAANSVPPTPPALASVSGSAAPPFRVRVEAVGIVMLYTLADEHLKKVWQTLQDCHSLDSAKERLSRAIQAKQKNAKLTDAGPVMPDVS